jgi:hypothetical protein
MRRAKSIDELYEEAKGYDLVISNDAALVTALNGRIDRPHVGYFAMTPMNIASTLCGRILGEPAYGQLRTVTLIADETGRDFKHVHSELDNITDIRKHTSEVGKYLFSKASKEIFESWRSIPTLEKAMAEFDQDRIDFFASKKTAVIGMDWFDELDKAFIPYECDEIDLFTDEEYAIDTVYCIGNDRQIADSIVSLIVPDKAEDFAIVLNTSAPITDAVRSALYRADIPFINSLSVRDLTQIRDFIQFVSMAMSYDTVRVGHVRELFLNYNAKLSPRADKYLLSALPDEMMSPSAIELRGIMAEIREKTFGEVMEGLHTRGEPQVSLILKEMELIDKPVTAKRLGWLIYAVDNVSDLKHNEQIPDNERKGVLIADVTRSVYVDRPVVIFAGLSQDWDLKTRFKPYIDMQTESEKYTEKMEILLQQGQRRIYCGNVTKNGKPVRPSLVFDAIFGMPIGSFDKIAERVVNGPWVHGVIPVVFPDEGSKDEYEDPDIRFSKSSYNKYLSCPKAFYFNIFLRSADNDRTEFGNLVHAFAEAYACYPDDVKRLGTDFFLPVLNEKYFGLSYPMMKTIDSEKFRMAMDHIMRYIDSIDIKDLPLDLDNDDRNYPNEFISAMGKTKRSSACESNLILESVAHGFPDLYWDGIVTDYKSGRSKDYKELCNSMEPDIADYVEIQPLLYLCLSRHNGDSESEFRQFYIMEGDLASARGKYNLRDSVRVIKVRDADIRTILKTEPSVPESLKLRNDIDDYPKFINIVCDNAAGDIESWGADKNLDEMLHGSFKIRKGESFKSSIEKLTGLVRDGIVCLCDCIIIPLDKLNEFEERLRKDHAEMISRCSRDFPASPIPNFDCEKCEFFTVCTKADTLNGGDDDA